MSPTVTEASFCRAILSVVMPMSPQALEDQIGREADGVEMDHGAER